jgi:hypothetical protein
MIKPEVEHRDQQPAPRAAFERKPLQGQRHEAMKR